MTRTLEELTKLAIAEHQKADKFDLDATAAPIAMTKQQPRVQWLDLADVDELIQKGRDLAKNQDLSQFDLRADSETERRIAELQAERDAIRQQIADLDRKEIDEIEINSLEAEVEALEAELKARQYSP